MFGVSSGELGLIFVVALIVLGPARLPGLVRKIGRWVGKARSMARDFQQQLENEVNLEELNRLTDARSKEAAKEPSAEPEANNLSGTGYPYGPQEAPIEPAAESTAPPQPASEPTADPAATAAPQPGDDTYSHAHAQGELPMNHEPAAQPDDEKKDSGTA